MTGDELRLIARALAQSGTPGLAAIARYYLATHPFPTHPPPQETAQVVLTEREANAVRLIALGYSNKQIATKGGVSVKTVETYRTRAMKKLGLRSRVELVRYAARQGWLTPDAPGIV